MDGELRVVSEKLQERFGIDGRAADAAVDREAQRLAGSARVHTFVPLLVERAARRRLSQEQCFRR
jgi:hypothetical protein